LDFGIFNLMGYRSAGASTREILEDAAVLTEIADQGGIGMAWFAEHHFSNYGICSSPLMMAAYCAPRTRRIRLATGILVLPLYKPARLLSEIAMADALSEGRLVLGIGTGYQPFEFERFGSDLASSKEVFEEFVDLIERGTTEEFVQFEGKHLSLPRTHIGPRFHAGRPDIWVAGHAPEVHRIAARRGYSIIVNGRFSTIDEVAAHRGKLKGVLREEGADPDRLHWGLLRYCCVTQSKEEAREYAENARWQLRVATSLRYREELQQGHMIMGDRPFKDEQTMEQILSSQMIGDVDTCIERGVDEIRKTGVNHISLYFQIGDYAHNKARRSLERFIGEVVPGIERELGPLRKLPSMAVPDAWQ
jgi:alkanesulfonate monooxygenase SsuD/methylene tetrahydromethanopterin reductase-like flavin-dependent oxidoreductase (luciferase family)